MRLAKNMKQVSVKKFAHIAVEKVSNDKAVILGTYHGLYKERLQSYLDGFVFRFIRRSFAALLLQRLIVAVALFHMAY